MVVALYCYINRPKSDALLFEYQSNLSNKAFPKQTTTIRIIQLMLCILLFQSLFDHKRENIAEIEEEIPQVEMYMLPTFKEKREKNLKDHA